jgi:hypothetical protein
MTHRLLGTLMIAAGAIVIILSIVAPRYALISSLVTLLLAFVFAHLFGTRAADARAKTDPA